MKKAETHQHPGTLWITFLDRVTFLYAVCPSDHMMYKVMQTRDRDASDPWNSYPRATFERADGQKIMTRIDEEVNDEHE